MRRLLTSTALVFLLAAPSMAAAEGIKKDLSLPQLDVKGAGLRVIGDFISYEPYAFMIRRGDANFRLAVNRVLMRLNRSAEVVPVYEKWFGPFPEGGSLIAALYVQNSVPE